ncbi:MAG TPA: biotin--[acetyl-CoA-carboxylase] ligase [Xanthobacteraceae bacterium]|nr:biotin--[acetyl-CoA-carboxylase] ligase [Xanthobacteraceae bacterium]
MQLDPVAIDAGVRLVALATVRSTNEEAAEQARRGESGPLWITAQSQTAGRGRLGRSWYSPPGNLYASLLLRDPSPFERAPELTFVAALALRDAIVAAAPSLAPQLHFKWPNDLLLAGDKCAGILIEGEVGRNNSMTVVIGIGVNCAHHPAVAPTLPPDVEPAPAQERPLGERTMLYRATDLRAHAANITPQQLFARLSATMCWRLAEWARGQGFAKILDAWLAAAHGLGEDIRIRQGDSEKTGLFVGLDRAGRLILQQPGGAIEEISAGDVFPLARRSVYKMQSRQG